MTTTLPPSYNTTAIYSTLPQYIQDLDSANNYQLWWYLYGSCKNLDNIDVLIQDGIGQGIHIEANFGNYTGFNITDGLLAKAISPTDTTITIFGTDASWNVINIASSFKLQIVDPYNGNTETITVPAGIYNWTAPYVILSGVTRGSTSYAFKASSGADGSTYPKDFGNAPGWSQILDVSRCPDYALPWLGQFVGAGILPQSSLTRQQRTQKIQERASFQRATGAAIAAELAAVVNGQLAASVTPLATNQILVMENTQANASAPYYTYNPYAVTILVPSTYYANYTYQTLQTAATQAFGSTYTNLNQFIASIGSFYYDLGASTVPNSSSPYVNFVYRYRPAGIQIFVGGY